MQGKICHVPFSCAAVAITDPRPSKPVVVSLLNKPRSNENREVVFANSDNQECKVIRIDNCLVGKDSTFQRCDYGLSTPKALFIGELKQNVDPELKGTTSKENIATRVMEASAQLKSSYENLPDLRDTGLKVYFLIHFPEHLRPALVTFFARESIKLVEVNPDFKYLILNSERVLTDNFVEV